jgi:hypothetical protein
MIRALVLIGIALCTLPARAQTFSRPFECSGCIANWYYFDHNGAAGAQQDWNCGGSTYDGHRGSDFSLAGGNDAIANGYNVVAAADGVVVSSEDGHYDMCRTCNAAVDDRCGTGYGWGYGNHVVINHGNYRVVYAHMRSGSVRVGMNDMVRCGDVIGQIGSSGCTTGAHLHFETRPLGGASTTAFDPFGGGCSGGSYWTDQGAYRGVPGTSCGTVTPTCPSGTYPIWTCNTAGTERRRCIDGVDMIEPCPYGCISMPVGTDDVCAQPPDADGDGARADVDCDDGNAARHPGAFETCGDGVDQDCDGSDLTCPGVDAGMSTGTDAGMTASDAGSTIDTDAGSLRRDAGTMPFDAGTRAPTLVGSCTCRAGAGATGSALGSALGLLALGLLMRRR